MKKKMKLTPLEKSWILYDIGNSAFTLLASTLIQIFFTDLADSCGVDPTYQLSCWAFAGSISTIIVAIIAPICGTLSDRKYKKPIFFFAVVLGSAGCALMGLTGHWMAYLVVFVIAKVGFSSSIVFYDSMLPEITTEERMDNISSMGYAFGYIGSVIPFVICLVPLICAKFSLIPMRAASVTSALITAVWWIVCSIPLLKQYKQTAYVEKQGTALVDTFRQIFRTFKEAKNEKHVFLYLIAFFFFINGVYTIIDMAVIYGKAQNLGDIGLLLALLLTQVVAFPCAIVFGRLSAKYDTGLLIKVCIICYTCIMIFGVFLASLWQFWTLAVMVGMFQGGIQALSRSYFGKIIKPEQSGEFYGLMDICGKGSSFLGTTLVGVVNIVAKDVQIPVFGVTLGSSNLAVGALIILFIIGYFIFCKADQLNKARMQ